MIPAATTPSIGIRGANSGGAPLPPPAVGASPGAAPPIPATIEATPVETRVQKENLAQYQQRDRDYQDILNQQHKRHLHLAQEKKREIEIGQHERKVRLHGPQGVVATFGPGYRGLGNGTTGMQSRLVYPRDKKRLRRTPLLKL
jgi:SWI/SNF-related matrix-associated actin-dependent regulator of chromatin subfamily B protein 1